MLLLELEGLVLIQTQYLVVHASHGLDELRRHLLLAVVVLVLHVILLEGQFLLLSSWYLLLES